MVESPTDNLRREMTQRLTDLDARVTQRFELEEKERSNALAAQDKRLELLNELRTGVMTRAEYEAKHKAIEDRLRAVEKLVGPRRHEFVHFHPRELLKETEQPEVGYDPTKSFEEQVDFLDSREMVP